MRSLANAPFIRGTDPSAYPMVSDFAVHPVDAGILGVHMEWTSAEYGLLTQLHWWDDLGSSRSRLAEAEWSREWTRDEPFVDADQDWSFEAWYDDHFRLCAPGPSPAELDWYRVPRESFRAAIKRFLEAMGK